MKKSACGHGIWVSSFTRATRSQHCHLPFDPWTGHYHLPSRQIESMAGRTQPMITRLLGFHTRLHREGIPALPPMNVRAHRGVALAPETDCIRPEQNGLQIVLIQALYCEERRPLSMRKLMDAYQDMPFVR
ncbi:hypothetical protein BU26DRAFT_302405 [Trematosphaeria pertusa]|uniref:Uncharacterized protein n=1 Tax=Trematosphaeria pertusa TaxID=390896 RepID=A0A6A6IGE9_9PLEO|nr:uncharacterized protein BU26DRAFT_302405 [Trematosphaeria pertusa]KAF2248620.1 hypothetical protein BU26DRAFT_302405 [Trematosphaeria pertusa]